MICWTINYYYFWVNYRKLDISRFTQLVWAITPSVGCAISNFTNHGDNNYLFTCDYVYGNVIGARVYLSGSPDIYRRTLKILSIVTTSVNVIFHMSVLWNLWICNIIILYNCVCNNWINILNTSCSYLWIRNEIGKIISYDVAIIAQRECWL